MNKIDKMKQAEQFLPKDVLYGTMAGLKVIDLLESHADEIVQDEETVDQLAEKIKGALIGKDDNPLYVPVHDTIKEFLPADIFADNSKELFKDELISKLPYKGNIVYDGKEINIAEYIKSLPLNDDYQIQVDPSITPRSIFTECKQIFMFEPWKPTVIEKMNYMKDVIDSLETDCPNFIELFDTNKNFQDECKNGIKHMNDELNIVIGEEVYDPINYYRNLYQKFSERLYNSVDSKPNLVEPIDITRGNGVSEATSNYVFLSDEERESLINNTYNKTDADKLNEFFMGVLKADTTTIEIYKNKIKDFYGDEESSMKNKVVRETIETSRNLEFIHDNNEDLELMIENTINSIQADLESVKSEYYRTFEIKEELITELLFRITSVRNQATEMNVKLTNKIEEVRNDINLFRVQVEETKDNENHLKKQITIELESKERDISRLIYNINQADRLPDKAGLEARLDIKTKEYNKLLKDNARLFNEDEYEELVGNVNRMLLNNGYDAMIERVGSYESR